MKRRERIDLLGGTVLVGFSGLMGLNQVMIKLVNAGMPSVLQAGLRSALAFLPILLFARYMGKRLTISDGSLVPGIVSGTLFAVEFYLLFLGLEFTSVARASVLFYTMPIWVAVGAHFLIPGERLTTRRLLGLTIAVVGVIIALMHNPRPATDMALIGDLMCLAAALCWAAIALTARVTEFHKAVPEMQLLYQLAVSAPILLTIALYSGPPTLSMTPALWSIFSVQVFVVVCVGFLSWFWVLSIYPASDMASFAFLAPVFGVFFGWLILGEAISGSILLALVLVAVGIVLVARR